MDLHHLSPAGLPALSEAQWLAYAISYRCFADILANVCARLGANVDRYSFIVVDSHHLLLASLLAHSVYGKPGLSFAVVGHIYAHFCMFGGVK